jgi:cob(I)alamin adenosyltransferase
MPRITKVTTRRGDEGNTDLADSKRIRKDSKRIQAIGSLDELNSMLGVVRTQPLQEATAVSLREIQNDLFCIGAMIARTSTPSKRSAGPLLDPHKIQTMESESKSLQDQLGSLENFLLPGGTPGAAALHLARAVCRRAERDVIALARTTAVAPDIRIYLNRLSDLLFQFARLENKAAGRSESTWNSR